MCFLAILCGENYIHSFILTIKKQFVLNEANVCLVH